jgi:Spy/CpxP family protein refolding chaperone
MRKLTAATVAAVAALTLGGTGAALASTGHPVHAKHEVASSRDRHADRMSKERSSRDRQSKLEHGSSRDRAHVERSTERSN